MVAWLRDAGFDLRTRKPDGGAVRLLRGRWSPAGAHRWRHRRWPRGLRLSGAMGECKCLGDEVLGASSRRTACRRQARLRRASGDLPGLSRTARAPRRLSRRSTPTRWRSTPSSVPFDAALAQRMSRSGGKVISATEAGELLPRAFNDSTHFECRMCAWQDRSWSPDIETTPPLNHGTRRAMIDARQAALMLNLPTYWLSKPRSAPQRPAYDYRVGKLRALQAINELEAWIVAQQRIRSRRLRML